jgi:hypothetical protein
MMTPSNDAAATSEMLNLLAGSWVTQSLYIVAKLGIADLLREMPKTCDTLAEQTQCDANALYRILRALASLGVFAEDEHGQFSLTPPAQCLCSDVPNSLRAFALMLGGEEHWQSWGDALHSVRTGEPSFDHVFGMPRFRYYAEHPEAARAFNEAMISRSTWEDAACICNYDFSQFATVVDVGGGHGSLLSAILQIKTDTRGVLFDLPHVAESARVALTGAEIESRIDITEGDFFDAVPEGGDACVLKKIIHNWDDAHSMTILANCRNAMSSTGRLLVIEPLIPPGNGPSFNKLLDLLMLVYTSNGKERTEVEHRVLLASAGFELVRVISTGSDVAILEAMPS